ncbi:MAG: response regulator transcription factor [Acidobacteriaceae bacterium]
MKPLNVSKVDAAPLRMLASTPRPRKREGVSRFPAMPIRAYVLRFDPMRAAGLQALFPENAGIQIEVEKEGEAVGSGWLDPGIRVVVLGTHLGSGTQKLILEILIARPGIPILVMSPAAGDEAILSVLSLGAKGFLHEAATAEQFEEAVRALIAGSIWAPRRLLSELINRLLATRTPQPSIDTAKFTGREQQVLNLLLDGSSNREIAENLQIDERTVKSYVTRLFRKMSVRNRTALSMLAMSSRIR